MPRLFIPREWRLARYVWFLMVFEFPFTVANLALFGIASPNLYRTILWNEGGKMGFNSDTTTVVYAYANYRPVTIPVVWSGFNTQYHLVIGVVCMFFYLIKTTMWLLHVFLPIFSILLHVPLLAIWAYGIHIQTSPDTIDPLRRNTGAPWYITKNCNIVKDARVKGYCMQAKSSFVVSCIMLVIYTLFLLLSLYSMYPTPAQRAAHRAHRAEKKAEKEKWASPDPNADVDQMSPEQQWQHMWELQQLPRTPGAPPYGSSAGGNPAGNAGGYAASAGHVSYLKNPTTPRTQAFGDLEGGRPEIGNADAHAAYQAELHQPRPSWVAHAHGQMPGAGGNTWYGGAAAQQGFVSVQQVSPINERAEYEYGGEEGGKRGVGFAH